MIRPIQLPLQIVIFSEGTTLGKKMRGKKVEKWGNRMCVWNCLWSILSAKGRSECLPGRTLAGGCVARGDREMGKMMQKGVQGDRKDLSEGRRGGCSARVT